jgi:hypothetical protein
MESNEPGHLSRDYTEAALPRLSHSVGYAATTDSNDESKYFTTTGDLAKAARIYCITYSKVECASEQEADVKQTARSEVLA